MPTKGLFVMAGSDFNNSGFTEELPSFLSSNENDFRSAMVEYIRQNFSGLLSDDDLKLLNEGDTNSLEELSKRCRESYIKKMA